jgi:hypothetical protein
VSRLMQEITTLADCGPVHLSNEVTMDDAELAAKVVLADAWHRSYLEQHGQPFDTEWWQDLAADLRTLLAC